MAGAFFDELSAVAPSIEAWRDLIWGSKPAFQRLETRGDRSFQGRLTRAVQDRISSHVVEVEARRHFVARTPAHIRRSSEPHYEILFQLEGTSLFRQSGREALLRPGDMTFSLTTEPYSWLYLGDFRVNILILPRALFDAPPAALERLTSRVLDRSNPLAGYLSPFITQLSDDGSILTGRMGHRVMRNFIDLVSARVLAELEASASESERPRLLAFQRITDFIAQNLDDPELGTAMIARRHYLSPRSLQALFQEYGTTVSTWIREKRLAHIRHALADPTLHTLSVSEVAARHGFVEKSAFSHAFRAAFDESPRQWRHAALGPDATAHQNNFRTR